MFSEGLCRRNALHVLKLAWQTQPDVGFDAAGVRWLDNYIESNHRFLPEELAQEFVHLVGCFYGECLRVTLGGEWAQSGDQVGIFLEPVGYTYPFRAVARQLAEGERASIMNAFEAAIDHLDAVA